MAVCWAETFRCVSAYCRGEKTAVILEKQLLLYIKGLKGHFQTISSPLVGSEKFFSQGQNIQNSTQSSQEGIFQHIIPKVRLCNGQRNSKKPKNYITDSTGLSYHVTF